MVTALGLSAMNKMGYHAVNLGLREVQFSGNPDYKSFVSTNLIHELSGDYLTEPYRLIEINAMTVAVLGITSGRGMSNIPTVKIRQPAKALAAILPKMDAKADIIILLSDLNIESTQMLLEKFDSIDLAIAASGNKNKPVIKTNNGAFITSADAGCSGLSTITLAKDQDSIFDVKKEVIQLNESVEADPDIAEITGSDIGRTLEAIRLKKAREQTMIISKMDPMEMMKKMAEMGTSEEDQARFDRQQRILKQQEENKNE